MIERRVQGGGYPVQRPKDLLVLSRAATTMEELAAAATQIPRCPLDAGVQARSPPSEERRPCPMDRRVTEL